MNKQWIEAFLCVCKTESVSKAADMLFLSQPSVTNRIRALEQEVGGALFDRSGRRMLLTDAGRTFHSYALNILYEWENGREAVHQLSSKAQGELTIAVFYTGMSLFTPSFVSFSEKYPDVKLSIQTRHSEEVGDLIFNHIAQIGIARTLNNKDVVTETVLSDQFVLAVYPGHPLAKKRMVHQEMDIQEEKLILLYSGGHDWGIIHRFFNEQDIRDQVVVETDSIDICKQYVKAKKGIALLPYFSIDKEVKEGTLIVVEQEQSSLDLSRDIDLIWLKRQSGNRLLSLFVQHVRTEFGLVRT